MVDVGLKFSGWILIAGTEWTRTIPHLGCSDGSGEGGGSGACNTRQPPHATTPRRLGH